MMLRVIIGIWMILGFSFLTGCTARPNDNRFAPVYPNIPQPKVNRSGSLYSDATAVSLYQDTVARRIGDILTIRLTERTSGKKEATTNTDRKTSVEVTNPTILGKQHTFDNGRMGFGKKLDSEGSFEGSGDSEQKNDLTGTITVSVVKVLGNGNLVVRGEKWIHINRGKEYVRLTGIVRPADIDETNAVDSTRVADARIAYSGTGQVAESNVAGWFARFFMGALGGLFPF